MARVGPAQSVVFRHQIGGVQELKENFRHMEIVPKKAKPRRNRSNSNQLPIQLAAKGVISKVLKGIKEDQEKTSKSSERTLHRLTPLHCRSHDQTPPRQTRRGNL